MAEYLTTSGIRAFTPDDDEDTIYLVYGRPLNEIIEKVNEKWPGTDFSKIEIEAQHIHTYALGYDLYDSSDYDDYIVIRRNP